MEGAYQMCIYGYKNAFLKKNNRYIVPFLQCWKTYVNTWNHWRLISNQALVHIWLHGFDLAYAVFL